MEELNFGDDAYDGEGRFDLDDDFGRDIDDALDWLEENDE